MKLLPLSIIVCLCVIVYSLYDSKKHPRHNTFESGPRTDIVGYAADNVKIVANGGFFSPAATKRTIGVAPKIVVYRNMSSSSSGRKKDADMYPDLRHQ